MISGPVWIRIGAILGALAVVAGAFGAHALRDRVESRKMEPRDYEIFETAAKYQMYHALALVAVGILMTMTGRADMASTIAAWTFLLGILIFSGTLYGIALGGPRWLGAITPIGGVSMIIGWIALALVAFTRTGSEAPL